MRKILFLAIAFIFLQFSFAESVFPSSIIQNRIVGIIVQPQIKIVPQNSVQKGTTLKERLLLKWYKKKMSHTVSEEKEKKTIKTLGLVSIVASLLGPFTALLAFTSASPGVFVFGGIIFCLAAVILGLAALKKRKKLTDKSGTSNVPALIGIIIGGLFIIGLLSLYSFVNL
jgi:cation transport ATPase